MEDKNTSPLASEMYEDLKETNHFLRKMLIGAFIVMGILVFALAGTNLYHIYQWSQFDTYVVDSGDSGNSNLVYGDNGGGIYNGTDSSETAQERQFQGSIGQD